MSMYKGMMWRSYLLKNDFWAKKGNEQGNMDKTFIKHKNGVGIYATILQDGETKGVKITVDGQETQFFNNFDKLSEFLASLQQKQNDFLKILRRRTISNKLRMLDI